MYTLCSDKKGEQIISYKGAIPVYGNYEDAIQPVDAFDAMLSTSETSPLVCTRRPVGITEVAVILVNTSKLRHQEDLRADDVGGWCHKGKPVRFYSIERMPSGEVYGAQRCDDGTNGAFKLIRIYYHHKGTPEFRKTIFYAYGMVLSY